MMLNDNVLGTEPPQPLVMELVQGFSVFSTPPNALPDAHAASQHTGVRQPVQVPGALAGCVPTDGVVYDHTKLDQQDHWYHLEFARPLDVCQRYCLQFDGLLTVAEVYLNGQRIVQSNSAYHAHSIDVTTHLADTNQLWLCFRAIHPFYSAKQPRARYMTRLINERHLRFLRTPVLGYTPGFASPAKPVGPYRPIRLLGYSRYQVQSTKIHTQLLEHHIGQVDVSLALQVWGALPRSATLMMRQGDAVLAQTPLTLATNGDLLTLTGHMQQAVAPYWPHTHGTPQRYTLEVHMENGDTLSLGQHGFRRIERAAGERFMLHLNGQAMFLRGACWTPMNPTRLYSDAQALRQRLMMLRDAGFNLLRIPGNMLYETDAFYALCDELGMLVFQDFAFTNFDYPESDDFLASVETEVAQFLGKHGWRPCLLALCGGSEVAQQAAMMGMPLAQINQTLFTEFIPRLVAKHVPGVPYVVSSPYASQGMPFHVGDSVNTYFGVGGYLRSFEDARLFKGRFITECLPFSHVPEESSLRAFWGGEIPPTHTPQWKDGVTRDPGSGWDFSDVTDFYLQQLFGLDPVRLRAVSPERYLAYCRATVVEAVETTMSIFRADSASGRAALVWLLHDLKPGAGWGYIDSLGQPKSAFYALGRVFQPTTVVFVDEGLEGLAVYAAHDGAQTQAASLEISLLTEQGALFAQGKTELTLAARSVQRFSVDTLIGHFVDSSYAYRFGARAFVACVAQLRAADGSLLSQKVYVPSAETQTLVNDAGLAVSSQQTGEGEYTLNITCQSSAYFVTLELPGFQLSNNYFHLMPGFAQTVTVKAQSAAQTLQGRIRALNVRASTAIKS